MEEPSELSPPNRYAIRESMPKDIVEEVHAILRARNGRVDMSPRLPLGSGGLGLDSIALVEVLVECEEVFGVTMAAEALAGSPLTVGSLIEALQARVRR